MNKAKTKTKKTALGSSPALAALGDVPAETTKKKPAKKRSVPAILEGSVDEARARVKARPKNKAPKEFVELVGGFGYVAILRPEVFEDDGLPVPGPGEYPDWVVEPDSKEYPKAVLAMMDRAENEPVPGYEPATQAEMGLVDPSGEAGDLPGYYQCGVTRDGLAVFAPSVRTRATFHVRRDIVERARRTVVALQGPPHLMTLSAFAEKALVAECERLEKAHNNGRQYPDQGRPRTGRPLKL